MKKKLSYIRICGGKWRSRPLTVIPHIYLRPTTNKMRETIFNWLSPVIKNANCLDCFSGSGALGLESLSRGADTVTFIENNYKIYLQLIKNIALFKTKKTKLITIDAITWLKKQGDSFNIVFLDPPFYSKLINNTIVILEKYKRLTSKSYIYIETEINYIIKTPSYWKLYKQKITQRVIYSLYTRDISN